MSDDGMVDLTDTQRAVLGALDAALKARREHPVPLPEGANEDTQFALWLRATRGPYTGIEKFGTCTECGKVVVGSWYALTSGVLLGCEVRRYDGPGCYMFRCTMEEWLP